MKKFTKNEARVLYGQLKILARYLTQYSQKDFGAYSLSTYDFSTLYIQFCPIIKSTRNLQNYLRGLFKGTFLFILLIMIGMHFSSPEHNVLRVSYCDRPVSGVRRASSVVYNLLQMTSPP